jgi:hypothetical protein
MKHKVTYMSAIIAAIGLVALLTVQSRAHSFDRESDDFSNVVVTLSAGQTLRISVANSLPPSAQVGEGRKFKMLFAATVFETNGRLIAHSDEITLAPGEFHSFDFNRADLPPSVERGIGALQLRCEIRRHTFPGFGGGVTVAGADVNVVEIIDNLTGQTQASTSLNKDVDLSSPNNHSQVQPSLLGLAYGQSLRVNVAHLSEGARRQVLRARIVLNDAGGNAIAQSSELAISPGEFRSYDFSRGDLPLMANLAPVACKSRQTFFSSLIPKTSARSRPPLSSWTTVREGPLPSWFWLFKRSKK